MRRKIFIFIMVFYVLFFPVRLLMAQDIPWRNHRLEASYSYEYLDPRQAYGDWHTLNLALYTDISPTFTYLVEGTLFNRHGDNGIAGTVGAYKYWSSWLNTYSAISVGSNTEYLHRFRADHDFNLKVGKENICVLTAGATYINYSDNRYDFIVSGGPVLYLDKWILQYRLFRNESNPGSVESFSHLISIGYGMEYWQWTYLNISFGNQAYMATYLSTPEAVNNDSLEIALKHRHWLGKYYGIFGEVSYFKLEEGYEKYEITCGVFYVF